MENNTELRPEELRDAARAVIAACEPIANYRARAQVLAEAGLLGVMAPDHCGGLGLPMHFAVPVLEEAGAALLPFALLETQLLATAFASCAPELAAALVEGQQTATIAWSGACLDDQQRVGRAPCLADCDWVLVEVAQGHAELLPVSAGQVQTSVGVGLDLVHPEADFVVASCQSAIQLDAEAFAQLRRDAWLMRAAMVAGSAQQCLDLACEYAQQRKQFKRVLAANQAIAHKLARQALNVATIKNSLSRALDVHATEAPLAHAACFVGACDLGAEVVEAAIQVYGGMGFTWDLPLHRHLRQIKAWSAQGSKAQATAVMAQVAWARALA